MIQKHLLETRKFAQLALFWAFFSWTHLWCSFEPEPDRIAFGSQAISGV